jgi:hypothetical protein
MSDAGADPSIHPIFGVKSNVPLFDTGMRQAAKTPERVELGQQIGGLANMVQGFNDSPVGGLAGSSGGSSVWSGPSQEGPAPGRIAGDLGDIGDIAAL